MKEFFKKKKKKKKKTLLNKSNMNAFFQPL